MRDARHKTGRRAKRVHTGILHSAFCLLPFLIAGCSTHRTNDWKDVCNATVGESYGISVRLGPIRTGLYSGRDDKGLRSGVTGNTTGQIANYDYYWLFYGREHFDGWRDARDPRVRRKVVAAEYFFPCFIIPEAENPYAKSMVYGDQAYNKLTDGSRNYAYWTQLDIAMGLGDGFRLGFNPGELLDALLGYVGIDIYGDDTTWAEERAKLEAPGEVKAPFEDEPPPVRHDPDAVPVPHTIERVR